MMGKTVQPKGGHFWGSVASGFANMKRIRHDQWAAHPQAMETSDETDNQWGDEVETKNHNLKPETNSKSKNQMLKKL